MENEKKEKEIYIYIYNVYLKNMYINYYVCKICCEI